MTERKPITAIVGCYPQIDTIPRKYFPSTEEFLKLVARVCISRTEIRTNESRVLVALQALHRQGLIELVIDHIPSGQKIHLDVKGEFIEPWPDELFELEFHLRFSTFEGISI